MNNNLGIMSYQIPAIQIAAQNMISFLQQNKISVGISGADVRPDMSNPSYVKISLVPYGPTGTNEVMSKHKDISRILGFRHVDIRNGDNGTICVECYKSPDSVTLDESIVYDKFAAPIGIELSTGQPLVVDITRPNSCHIGIFGMTGSGKTVMAHGFMSRLCANTKAHDLSLVLLDPKRDDAFASHVSKNVAIYASEPDECIQAARHVTKILQSRREDRSNILPRIAVYCDEFSDMMKLCGSEMETHISRIASTGRDCGIHLIVGTQHASRDQVDAIVKVNLPMTIIGKVADSTASRVCSGRSGTGAENIAGSGEFIALSNGQKFYFKAPMFTPSNTGIVPQRFMQTKSVASHVSVQHAPKYNARQSRVDSLTDLISEALVSMPDFFDISQNELLRRVGVRNEQGKPMDRIQGSAFAEDWRIAYSNAVANRNATATVAN